MLSLTIKKRNKTRVVYIPYSPYWNKSGKELAADQDRARAYYPARNFRFEGDLTVYRRGHLTIEFGPHGYAQSGYSYDACLFTMSPPSEDYPNGRLIWNDTQYSVTTNSKHVYTLRSFAEGPVTSKRVVTEHIGDETYRYTRYDHKQWDLRCEVLHMPWVCGPRDLRDEVTTWRNMAEGAEIEKWSNARRREARARAKREKMIASGKHLRLVGGM